MTFQRLLDRTRGYAGTRGVWIVSVDEISPSQHYVRQDFMGQRAFQ